MGEPKRPWHEDEMATLFPTRPPDSNGMSSYAILQEACTPFQFYYSAVNSTHDVGMVAVIARINMHGPPNPLPNLAKIIKIFGTKDVARVEINNLRNLYTDTSSSQSALSPVSSSSLELPHLIHSEENPQISHAQDSTEDADEVFILALHSPLLSSISHYHEQETPHSRGLDTTMPILYDTGLDDLLWTPPGSVCNQVPSTSRLTPTRTYSVLSVPTHDMSSQQISTNEGLRYFSHDDEFRRYYPSSGVADEFDYGIASTGQRAERSLSPDLSSDLFPGVDPSEVAEETDPLWMLHPYGNPDYTSNQDNNMGSNVISGDDLTKAVEGSQSDVYMKDHEVDLLVRVVKRSYGDSYSVCDCDSVLLGKLSRMLFSDAELCSGFPVLKANHSKKVDWILAKVMSTLPGRVDEDDVARRRRLTRALVKTGHLVRRRLGLGIARDGSLIQRKDARPRKVVMKENRKKVNVVKPVTPSGSAQLSSQRVLSTKLVARPSTVRRRAQVDVATEVAPAESSQPSSQSALSTKLVARPKIVPRRAQVDLVTEVTPFGSSQPNARCTLSKKKKVAPRNFLRKSQVAALAAKCRESKKESRRVAIGRVQPDVYFYLQLYTQLLGPPMKKLKDRNQREWLRSQLQEHFPCDDEQARLARVFGMMWHERTLNRCRKAVNKSQETCTTMMAEWIASSVEHGSVETVIK